MTRPSWAHGDNTNPRGALMSTRFLIYVPSFTRRTLAFLALSACATEAPTEFVTESPTEFVIDMAAAVASPGGVGDLSVTLATDSTITVRWTQIDDGVGQPANYRLKYAIPPI